MKWFQALRTRYILLILFCIGVFLYSFSLGNSFLWDDEQFVQKNTYVQNLSTWPDYFTTNTIAGAGFMSGYYRPLTTLSFALDAHFFGLYPFPFHAVNTLMHASSGVLLYLVLLELFSYMGLKKQKAFSFILSTIFLIHPTQVEAVANISSRGDSLNTLFGLFCLYFFLHLHRLKHENTVIIYAFFTLCFAISAVLSKEIGVIWTGLPILLYIIRSLAKKTYPKAQGYTAVALLGIGGMYTLLHMTILNFQKSQNLGWPEAYTNSVFVRIATFIFHAIPEYIKILLVPIDLHMERTIPIVTSYTNVDLSSLLILISFILFIFASMVCMYKKDRSLCLIQSIGLIWFFVFLLPVSGIIPSNGLIYEHWLYLPMIGFWMFILTPLLFIYKHQKEVLKLYILICTIIFVLWSISSVVAMFRYKSPLTFYPYTLKYAKTVRLYNNLGMAYAEDGQFEKAEHTYKEALEIYPGYPQVFHNLGNLYYSQGKYDDALTYFKKALDVDPTFFFSVNKLIEMYANTKEYEKAKYWAEYGNKTFGQTTSYYSKILTSLSSVSIGSASSQLSSP